MWNDLRVTIRALLRKPSFTAIVVLTLALGLGAATAVFSVTSAVLLRPLPFADADRVLILGEFSPSSSTRFVAPVTYDDWRTRQQAFEELAAFRYWETVNLEDTTGDPEPITLTTGTDNLFRALGVAPLFGRTYREEQIREGGSEAVISHELWTRRYQKDPGVLGRVIRIRGTTTTIVGVMPPIPASAAVGWGDVWTCLYRYNIAQQRATGYRSRYLTVVGRLAPGISVEQATTRMEALQRQLWTEPTSVAEGFDVRLQPLADLLLGPSRLPLLVVSGAVAALLLVACANVATLMLVRTSSRRRETATRLALGAGPSRVVRLLVLEGVVLALAGGVVGLGIAWASIRALAGIGTALPRFGEAGLTPGTIGFALALSGAVALMCAVAPSFELGRSNLSGVLTETGRSGTASRRAQRLRHLLVGLQIAMACLLLIAGSLLLRSFANVLRVDPGFDAERATYFDLYIPGSRYPDDASYVRSYRDLIRELEAMPSVEAAGSLLYFPYKPKLWPASIEIEGSPVPEGQEPVVYYNQIAGGYFDAMKIPLEAGRLPSEQEIWEGGSRVIVVNRAFARRLFGEASPIGRRIRSGRDEPWSEIIGIVGDVRQQRLDIPAEPEYYTMFQRMPMPFQSLVVRGRGRTVPVGDVRRAVQRLDPGVALANLMPLSEWVRLHTRERQFAVWVLATFAALALGLGAVGVYGAVSYSVEQRGREMGIRLALGETPRGLRAHVLRDGMRVVAVGILAGILGSIAATPIMQRLLFGVAPFDPLVYLGVPTLLVAVAALACWRPASAAARIEVTDALRIE
jgi:putative ABC transport system permease protein